MIAPKNEINSTGAHVSERHSNFSISSILAGNYRFGELSPFDVIDTVPGDERIRYQSHTNLRSLNLKAPLQQEVRLYKDYFHVPMPAILPKNWDKYEKMPNIGDDINPDEVGTNVKEFVLKVSHLISIGFNNLSSSPSSLIRFADIIRLINFASTVFSAGSLVSQLGTNFWPLMKVTYKGKEHYLDEFIDLFYSDFLAHLVDVENRTFRVSFDGQSEFFVVYPSLIDDPSRDFENTETTRKVAISFRKFLELSRDNPHFVLYENPNTTGTFDFDGLVGLSVSFDGVNSQDYDMKYLLGYQLVCAHFFSNDSVDYVYSAQLYRQNVYDAIYKFYSTYFNVSEVASNNFTYNGQIYEYDFLSAHWFNTVLQKELSYIEVGDSSILTEFLDYWNLLFNVRNSPRFVDYFTGSKTRPLAVADTTIPVTSEGVQVLDMTLPTAMARLAYFVNRVGRKAKKYMQEIFNVDVKPDYHEPWFLSRTTDYIGSPETENTNVNPSAADSGDSQTTISNFRSQSNQYAFETDSDVNGVIIGIMSFDINRLYGKGVSHFNYHHDRYDMFNPLLQYTGDQPVYQNEIDSRTNSELYFGYQSKYMEYKQGINRCFGAVALGKLPGFYFVAKDRRDDNGQIKLSPSFIRCYPYEFDDLYISLTATSPATYFHFIVDSTNSVEMSRPMVAKPGLEI